MVHRLFAQQFSQPSFNDLWKNPRRIAAVEHRKFAQPTNQPVGLSSSEKCWYSIRDRGRRYRDRLTRAFIVLSTAARRTWSGGGGGDGEERERDSAASPAAVPCRHYGRCVPFRSRRSAPFPHSATAAHGRSHRLGRRRETAARRKRIKTGSQRAQVWSERAALCRRKLTARKQFRERLERGTTTTRETTAQTLSKSGLLGRDRKLFSES